MHPSESAYTRTAPRGQDPVRAAARRPAPPRPGPAARLAGRGQQRRGAGQRQHEGPEGLPGQRGRRRGRWGRLLRAVQMACTANHSFLHSRRNSSGLAQAAPLPGSPQRNRRGCPWPGWVRLASSARTLRPRHRRPGVSSLSTILKETDLPEVKAWPGLLSEQVAPVWRGFLISVRHPGKAWSRLDSERSATYRTAWTSRGQSTPRVPPGPPAITGSNVHCVQALSACPIPSNIA